MTESEWLASADSQAMLEIVAAQASERQLRLFVCACCRALDGFVDKGRGQHAVDVAERYADGGASKDELAAARASADNEAELDWYHNYGWCWNLPNNEEWPSVVAADDPLGVEQAAAAANGAVLCATDLERLRHRQAEDVLAVQAALVRDIFANPFRPVNVDSFWRTPTVVALARAAYEERILPAGTLDALRLAVLADALEEHGANAAVVEHLRGPGPHVRGCWAVDCLGAWERRGSCIVNKSLLH
jgi:hypothetical protein